jgi:acyl-CoA synthetase (AMP-forming)/AMP-acid ligase II
VSLTSVVELLARGARDYPDRPAIIVAGRAWSYAEIAGGAQAVARGLRRSGVGAGHRVLLALPNGAEFFLAFFGTLIAGGVTVPAFPRSAPERLDSLARLAGATTIITPGSLPRGTGPLAAVPDDPSRPCYIQYTSGSTADPRGAVITHQNLLVNIDQMIQAMDITANDIFVSWLPTYHDMGLTLMALTPLSLGARLVLLPTDLRDVAGWLRAIEAHRGTFTAGPDFAYRLCLRNVRHRSGFDLSSLKVCMNASEPVRNETLTGFEAAFGLRHVMMTGYGLAEATLSVTCTRRGQPIEVDERGLVCLGQPMPGTTVAIVGPDCALPAGETGEIVVAGPSTCAGYHENPAATAALAWQDGHIRTGDLGYLDQASQLFFVARSKEVINLAGRTIYPQEVESLVDGVGPVRVSAAVGIDRGGVEGEQLHVFAEVRRAEAATQAELAAVANQIVRAVHDALGARPRSTILLRPRSIPMTNNGKIQRAVLRAAFAGGLMLPGEHVVFPPPVSATRQG